MKYLYLKLGRSNAQLKYCLQIDSIKNIFEKDVPYILRTLNVNQYFNRGTCREIKESKNWGIIQAIKKVLKESRDIPEKISSQQLFKLLNPHQFETLVFLILTNANIYSPAWRAGSLPDIDVIGINYSDSEIIMIGNNPSIKFERDKEVTFQIKQKKIKELKNDGWGITLDPPKKGELSKRLLTPEWSLDIIKNQEKTKIWLEYSLKWFMEDTGFSSIFNLVK